MNFLPENYQSPNSSNNYFKMQDGENRIRILSQSIIGWEDWQDKKPVRYRMADKPAKSFDSSKPVKHFWAFIIFNYNEEGIQIMQVTQSTIRKAIESLCKDRDWGIPYYYDIKINKTGTSKDTEYTVNPVPHRKVDPYIIRSFYDKPCNLEALFENEDPFAPYWQNYTQLQADKEKDPSDKNPQLGAHVRDLKDLREMFDKCSAQHREALMIDLKKVFPKAKSIEDVPANLVDHFREVLGKLTQEVQDVA